MTEAELADVDLPEIERLLALVGRWPANREQRYESDDAREALDSEGGRLAPLFMRLVAEARATRQAARDLSEQADACKDARALYDAIKAFCAKVAP